MDKYSELIRKRNSINAKIKFLEENDLIKRYVELKKQSESLYNKQMDLYKEKKEKEYNDCEHVLVYSDGFDESNKYCSCIKCGLDSSILDRVIVSFKDKIMFEYLKKYYSNGIRGIQIKKVCNLDVAHTIYSKIKEEYPDIDDETLVEYFESILEDMKKFGYEEKISLNLKKSTISDYYKKG